MIAYFDASALVKLLVEEPGSDDAALLWDAADAVLASRVVGPEVRAAIAAAHRGARLSSLQLADAKRSWAGLWAGLRLVEVTAEVAEHAADLAEQHALSGFDTIHLASAVVLGVGGLVVAAWDARLLGAARALGFATLPAGEAPGAGGGQGSGT